ncbi:hypothetical protein N481_10565 [Pseudoalteromonas luteoviolacea S4047-1]|uniref:YecA family protein n=2 Tax=Pseudoalteromonas luteoviolacea TaxID=43657 RepID=A0A0F6A4C5_9GAMM|nr:hypothetical protein N479_24425 [Pseudoalteromonas luteoviolacea S4054]KZN73873.1 hypothetical protein N481_10565 [Pseudoalteromonas luteoviolacea S4047-1]
MDFSYLPNHEALLNEYLEQRIQTNSEVFELKALQGFLFATVCGPDGIEPEMWLSHVTGGDEKISEDVVFAMLALHHHISEQVFSNGFVLPFDGESSWQDKQLWSTGFLYGCQSYLNKLNESDLLSDELKQALVTSTELLGFFSLEYAQVETYCQSIEVDINEFTTQQYQLAAEVAPAYAELIEQVALGSGLYND